MTNYDRWRILTQRITSPDSWINFGYYYLIGAALQRRVWLYGSGEDGMELYPNPYICLVGPPGLGKGLVTGIVARFLKHHKYEKGSFVKTSIGNELPPLFPVGADSLTFEEFLDDLADSIRRIPKPDGKIYVHTSYSFCLEEMDSLFKRKTQDVINFLKNAYDCKSYDYKTKHQGKNLLRNLCVSFMAGTQPDFLFEARKNGIFGQGFASRTLFLFEEKERFSTFHIAPETGDIEHKEAEKAILDWIKRLACLYGEIKYKNHRETYNFLESWYRDKHLPRKLKAPARMAEYLARKKVTMLKLAMCMHFGESLEMEIPAETFFRAIQLLDSIEPQMEKGLGLTGRNELHGFTRKIHEFVLSRRTATEKEIFLAFGADMAIDEIRKSLEELVITGSIKERADKKGSIYEA